METKERLAVVRFLLDEMECEQQYNEQYRQAHDDGTMECRDFYAKFPRQPRVSVIRENAKMARRLLLEVAKENG